MSDDPKELELPKGMTADVAADVLAEYHTTTDAQIMSQDALANKDEKIEEFAGVFRDILQDRRDLKEATVESMGVDALSAEFTNEDGELEADALAQPVETQQPNPNEDDGEQDALSGDAKEAVADKLRRADLLDSRTPEHADTLRSEAADLAGVDDHTEIEVDAL